MLLSPLSLVPVLQISGVVSRVVVLIQPKVVLVSLKVAFVVGAAGRGSVKVPVSDDVVEYSRGILLNPTVPQIWVI